VPKIKYLSYPEDVVNKVAEEIDALPPQARRLSETAVIKRLRKNIRSGLLKGYTLEQLVDIMRQNGMPITAKTIKSVLEKKSSPRRAKHQVDQTHPASPASIRRKNKTKAAAEPEHAAEPEQFITYEQPTETGVYFKPPPNPPEI
jgi:DNA-binding Lrp family transcriptional regulator